MDLDPFEGTVVMVTRAACEVWRDGEVHPCQLSPDLAKVQRTAIAVGDRVVVEPRLDAPPQVVEVLPRTTTLSRPDPMDPRLQRAIVANVDDVVIVVAAKRPTLKLRLVDRYLVAIQLGGARPVLVINKMDLLNERKRAALETSLLPYRDLNMPVILASAHDRHGLDDLAQVLAGRTCAFVGHSGVGKSSLLNALSGNQAADIGDVRKGDGKGRHTTTFSAMHLLPGGTRVIDTPGVRAFGLWNMSRVELRHWFPEFDDQPCRYADCVHDAEPEADCAVKRAVTAGDINAARFDAYLRLLEDLDR